MTASREQVKGTLSSMTETLELLQVATDGTTSLTQLRQDISTRTPTGGSFGGQVSVPVALNNAAHEIGHELVNRWSRVPGKGGSGRHVDER